MKYLRQQHPNFAYVSASDIRLTGRKDVPRPLTAVGMSSHASTAICLTYTTGRLGRDRRICRRIRSGRSECGGHSGIRRLEIHTANGYLIDQFLQGMSNKRTDDYGGSVENSCRFALKIVDAVCSAVGDQKTAIRISPWSTFQATDHPRLGYLHVIEPGLSGKADVQNQAGSAGGYTRTKAMHVATETRQLIAFGRAFTSNPDLPLRL
ncbi:hypothetical protein C8Q80DRAFT_1191628 [Daedaleopsis nitida]|nr:hypothetical protein C8Q80DRAFT_1191628 [Daedaleopsis nitida]